MQVFHMEVIQLIPGELTQPGLHRQVITEDDWALIDRHGIKDWAGHDLNKALSLRLSAKWVTNNERSLIFMPVGGGAFEIPDMFDLVYKQVRIRVHWGGGGARKMAYERTPGGELSCISFFRVQPHIPAELAHERPQILRVIAEALAVSEFGQPCSVPLSIQFGG